MQMTAEEICQHYSQASNKNKDISILAELNATDKESIRAILIDGGLLPPDPPRRTRKPRTIRLETDGEKAPKAAASPEGDHSRRGQRGRSGPLDASGVYSRVEQILDAIPGDASDRSRGFAFDLCLALFVDDMKKRLGIGKEAAGEQTKT